MLKAKDFPLDPESKFKYTIPGPLAKDSTLLTSSSPPLPQPAPRLKKFSMQELNEEYNEILFPSRYTKSKTGLGSHCHLSININEGLDKNNQLLLECQERESVLKSKISLFEEEKESAKRVEHELQSMLKRNVEEYDQVIAGLQGNLNDLNRKLALYENFLRLSVKKNKDEYICTAKVDEEEIVFSFKFEGARAYYIPIKVKFESHDMLNFKLSNLNKKELFIIFIRLLRSYLPNPE